MMMERIRKAGQSLIGKVIIFVMFGFLIFSFAIWGIGDIFRGYGRNTVAKVGKTEISIETMRNAYQNDVQNLTRQARRSIKPEELRAAGVDRQVLARLVNEAALDQAVGKLGLAASDEMIRQAILADPAFKGAGGEFSALQFNEFLRGNGYVEAAYVREQRNLTTRQALGEGVSGQLQVPGAVQEMIHRFRNERRTIVYATLPAAAVGDVPPATEAQLKSYFDERKAAFRAPDYRSASVLALTAAGLAKPEAVSDADARTRYEAVKDQRYGSPEKRTIQQIVFPLAEEAAAAAERLKAGETFEAIAAIRGIAEKDLTLGTLAKSEMVEKTVAEAAFALAPNVVSAPVTGAFGTVILRITEVQPSKMRLFEEVVAEVRAEVATSSASKALQDLHDKIEDQRAAAKPLATIAAELGLPLVAIGPIDRLRNGKDSRPAPPLPGGDPTLEALFKSDIGVDNEALRLRENGYVWFDITNIEPARDRSFDEVKADVEQQWRADEIAKRLSEKSRELAQRLDKGEAFDVAMASVGLPVKTSEPLGREVQSADLPRTIGTIVFGTPVGKTGTASLANEAGRVIFQVREATMPPFIRTTQEADTMARRLNEAFANDVLAQYVARVQTDLGLSISEQAFRNATGGAEN
jgi:peptidyl-prolyl cis-trans isomerase D